MQHFTPHPYQQAAIDAIIDKPSVGLWMEMGLGKTVVTLTAIDTLIYDAAEIRRVLVVAPKKVAEATWQDEVQKWDHLQHLRISTVLGTEAQRIAALNTPADVYIINRENCYWLVGYYGRHWPFDMVVLDEASSFKNHAAQRFKALKAVRPKIAKVVELTGTPAPNNLLDLWAQIYLLDQGERLGKYVTHYRQAYFWPTEYSWEAKDGAGDAIRRKISDLGLSFKAADLLELPYQELIWTSNYAADGAGRLLLRAAMQQPEAFGGRDYLVSLDENMALYTASDAEMVRCLGTGECVIGIGFLHDGMARITDDNCTGLRLIAPASGAPQKVDAAAIFQDAAHPSAAKLWTEYALSPECVDLAAQNGCYQYPVIDNAASVSLPAVIGLGSAPLLLPEDDGSEVDTWVDELMAALTEAGADTGADRFLAD